MSKHRNSLDNPNPHHLYQIDDAKEKDIFKFGISDDPIDKYGLSKRLRYQLNFLNRVAGWTRFLGKIIIINISGRRKAKKIEDAHIDAYIDKYGKRPRGNPTGGRKNRKK